MTPGAKHCPARETVGEPKAVCGLRIFKLHFTTGNRSGPIAVKLRRLFVSSYARDSIISNFAIRYFCPWRDSLHTLSWTRECCWQRIYAAIPMTPVENYQYQLVLVSVLVRLTASRTGTRVTGFLGLLVAATAEVISTSMNDEGTLG